MSLKLIINDTIEKSVFNFQEQLMRSENDKKVILNLSIDYTDNIKNGLTSLYLKELLPYFETGSINKMKIERVHDENGRNIIETVFESQEYSRIENYSIGLPDGEGDLFGSLIFINNLEEA